VADPSRFELNRAPITAGRRGGLAVLGWIGVLGIIIAVAILGRPAESPKAAPVVAAASHGATPAAGSAPASPIVQITPRVGIPRPSSSAYAGAILLVPPGWSREEGERRARLLADAMGVPLTRTSGATLRHGGVLVK
jgi:hypothetical protein